MPPVYVDRSIAGHHEVFEDTDWEFQDLVRLEMKWVLLLVVLALSRPEKARELVPQLLDGLLRTL